MTLAALRDLLDAALSGQRQAWKTAPDTDRTFLAGRIDALEAVAAACHDQPDIDGTLLLRRLAEGG